MYDLSVSSHLSVTRCRYLHRVYIMFAYIRLLSYYWWHKLCVLSLQQDASITRDSLVSNNEKTHSLRWHLIFKYNFGMTVEYGTIHWHKIIIWHVNPQNTSISFFTFLLY